MAKLSIVGTGPGSPDYIVPAARKAVQAAQVVIGAERSLNLFQADIKGETLKLTAKNVNEILEKATGMAKNGKYVVLLSTGDPGFSGLLCSILSRGLDKQVELDVIAGVSSIQACAARLSIPWDSASLFALHDGTTDKKKQELAEVVKSGKTVMLLPESKSFPPNKIAGFLLKSGAEKNSSVVVCENLTLDNEKIVEITLREASQQTFASLSVMVIHNSKRTRDG